MKKRETMILELLSQHGKMEVTSLAEQVGVSQVTIRKDLDALESMATPALAETMTSTTVWRSTMRKNG